MPPHDNSRNTILFVVIAGLMLLAYSYFVMEPQAQKRREAQQTVAESTSDCAHVDPGGYRSR